VAKDACRRQTNARPFVYFVWTMIVAYKTMLILELENRTSTASGVPIGNVSVSNGCTCAWSRFPSVGDTHAKIKSGDEVRAIYSHVVVAAAAAAASPWRCGGCCWLAGSIVNIHKDNNTIFFVHCCPQRRMRHRRRTNPHGQSRDSVFILSKFAFVGET
jgi:hypothetical protein